MSGPDEPPRSAPREELERRILGQEPRHTRDEVAGSAGVSLAQARRLWRALGFPDAGETPAFNDADQEALKRLAEAIESGVVDFSTAVRLTRAVGQTMARLADWQVATLTERVESIEAGPDATGSRLTAALGMVDEVGSLFEDLMIYAWRRHMAAAVTRVEALGAAEEDLHTARLTVGFADLVSFTSLSNGLDEVSLGDLVEGFESKATDVVTAMSGRVIKTLGDSVLFVTENATAGVETALRIVDAIAADTSLPDVRVGMASGNIITRLGDVFGSPVNLAARLTTVARRNRVIIDEDTAARLPRDRYAVRALPPRPLRGFGTVEPLAVRRTR